MSGHDLALLMHLVGVVFLFSGISIAGVLHTPARRQERPSQVALLLGLSRASALNYSAAAAIFLAFVLMIWKPQRSEFSPPYVIILSG